MTQEECRLMGMRIRDIRQQRSITSKTLADKACIGASHMSNIERAISAPSLDTIVSIVTVLDVSMDYIVLGIRPPFNHNGLIFRSDDELEESLLLTE